MLRRWVCILCVYQQVVDVQEEGDGQRYQWVLEFQCIDNDQGDVLFIGINFYSRSNTTRDLSQVGAVAAYGPALGDFQLHK